MKRTYTRLLCKIYFYTEDTIRTSGVEAVWDSETKEFVGGDLWS